MLPGSDVQAVRDVALRWTDATERADFDALRALAADDIVVVHGNGRTLCGRDAVLADMERSLRTFHVHQRIEFDETIVAGDWAFDRGRVRTTVRARSGGDAKQFKSRTLTILRRTSSGAWLIARAMGVIEAPPGEGS